MLSKLVKMTNEVTNYKKQESNIINLLVPGVLLSLLLLFSIIYVCSEKNTSENEKNRMESQKNRMESEKNRIESEKNRIESEKNRVESEKNRKAVNKILKKISKKTKKTKKSQRLALDACPRYYTELAARSIMNRHPEARLEKSKKKTIKNDFTESKSPKDCAEGIAAAKKYELISVEEFNKRYPDRAIICSWCHNPSCREAFCPKGGPWTWSEQHLGDRS